MRMAQYHRIDARRIERKRISVQRFFLATALHQAAIEQDADIPDLDQVAGTGDASRRSKRLQFHRIETLS